MWGPTEKCSDCGATRIGENEETGEFICCECGSLCEEWTPEPMALPAHKPSTVATLLADLADLELEAMRRKVA